MTVVGAVVGAVAVMHSLGAGFFASMPVVACAALGVAAAAAAAVREARVNRQAAVGAAYTLGYRHGTQHHDNDGGAAATGAARLEAL